MNKIRCFFAIVEELKNITDLVRFAVRSVLPAARRLVSVFQIFDYSRRIKNDYDVTQLFHFFTHVYMRKFE